MPSPPSFRSYGGRFTALATLPLNDPAASVKELERACHALHFRGAMLFSNVNGLGLDEQRFWPIYEAANELGSVLYIHPTNPLGVEAMTNYWLMPLVGFLMDTTLAAVEDCLQRRCRALSPHPMGAVPSRRHDSLSGRTARSRLPRFH